MAATRFILNTSGWNTVCERAVLADTPGLRLRGLLGRRELPSGEGMLLHRCGSVHTAFMRFAIDVVFLDQNYRVLRVVADMPPWRAAGARGAHYALELTAGEASRRGVEVGAQLLPLPQDPSAPAGGEDVAPAAAAHALTAAGRKRLTLARRTSVEGADAAPEIAVLVVSADRRFRTVISALLERRGCRVSVSDDPVNVARLTGETAPDVVLLDTDQSPAAPAQVVATLGATAPGTGVVLVGDGREERIGRLIVRPKWGVFDELVDAIDDAYWRRGRRKIPA